MFTGIVREQGRIAAVEGGQDGVRLLVEAPATAAQAAIGDSVAVSGVCLTVTAAENGRYQQVDLTPGPHHIEVRASGFIPSAFDVNVAPGRTTAYRTALRPQP